MRSLSAYLNRAYGRRGGRWQIAAALACACLALTFALCKVTFLNNDDANIMYALAGYRSGAPYPTHRFINVALGLLISGLYRVAPAVPWWTAWQIAALFVSLTVIFACVLRAADGAGLSLLAATGVCTLLYLTVFAYTAVWIAFTLTAGMLGTAACALVLAQDWERDTRAVRIGSSIGAIALLAACFLTRNSSGYSMCCFFGAAVLYRLMRAKGRMRLFALGFGVSALTAAACLVALNSWGISRFNPPYYAEFETARGHFIDYPHVTYAEDPAFFATLGWDQTVYDLADNLCYLDPAVDAAAMNAIAAYPQARSGGLLRRLAETLDYGEAYFRGSGVSQYMLVVPALLTLLLACAGFHKKRARAELSTGCAVAAGAFLLCFYLCYAGRFPVRIFMLIAIPTAVTELLLLLKMWGDKSDTEQNDGKSGDKKQKFKRILRYVGIFFVSAALAWSLGMTQSVLLGYDKSALVEKNAAAEAYVTARPENVYITDVTALENIGAFTVYPNEKPVNLIDWGGTGMYSGWKEAQLAANGLSALAPEMFARENVYFITERGGDKLDLLMEYLRAHAGALGAVVCDVLPGDLAVYRFEFDPAGGDA